MWFSYFMEVETRNLFSLPPYNEQQITGKKYTKLYTETKSLSSATFQGVIHEYAYLY